MSDNIKVVFWLAVFIFGFWWFSTRLSSPNDDKEAFCQAEFGMSCAEAKRESDQFWKDTMNQFPD